MLHKLANLNVVYVQLDTGVKVQGGASSQLQPRPPSKFWPILDVLKTSRYRWMILGIGLAYALIYMVFVGVISYIPTLKLATGMPVIRLYSILVTIIPADGIWIAFFYWPMVFVAISSFLAGLNIALIFYGRKVSKICSIRNTGTRGIFGLFLAFFTPGICCGGGMLALAVGATAFSYLAASSNFLAPVSSAALAAGTYLTSMKISSACR